MIDEVNEVCEVDIDYVFDKFVHCYLEPNPPIVKVFGEEYRVEDFVHLMDEDVLKKVLTYVYYFDYQLVVDEYMKLHKEEFGKEFDPDDDHLKDEGYENYAYTYYL